MNYYVVLGIPLNADDETIHSAFRTLARRYHPDAGKESSSEKFRQIVEAYETLGNPQRRRDYDRSQRSVHVRRMTRAEPLRSPVEPLASPRRSSPFPSPNYSATRFASRFDQIFDELFRSFEDDAPA